MLLNKLVSICLIVALAQNASAEKVKIEENSHSASFCENQTSEKCLSNGRKARSIVTPISNMVENMKSKVITEFTSIYEWASNAREQKNLIQCADKSLVIKVVTASVSNLDKTRCSKNEKLTNNKDCTEQELTTSTAIKMCNGRNKCLIQMDKEFSLGCECANNKYFDITYTCAKPTSSLIEQGIISAKNDVKRSKRSTMKSKEMHRRKRSNRNEKRDEEFKMRNAKRQDHRNKQKEYEKKRDKGEKKGDAGNKPSRDRKYRKGGPSDGESAKPLNFFNDYRFGPFDYYGPYDYYGYDDYYYGGDYYYDDYYYGGDYYYDDYYYDYLYPDYYYGGDYYGYY